MPPSAITGAPLRCRHLGDVEDRRHLRHADACDHARRADRSRPLADLERIGSDLDQRLGGGGGGDVPGDHLDRELILDRAHDVDHATRVAVRRVDDEDVHLGGDECGGSLQRVGADADRCAHTEPTAPVLRRERILRLLLDVLDRDQPLQVTVVVDNRELLDLVPAEDRRGLLERGAERRGDEVTTRHVRRHRLAGIGAEAEVAIRQDADEHAGLVHDRDAGDVVALHDRERVARRDRLSRG